jgi:hypothetical protein
MLREIPQVRQIPGERRRRWFSDGLLDLVVWLDAGGAPDGFQLTYDKGGSERSLTWSRDAGYVHAGIDDGETRPGHMKATPIVVADGIPDKPALVELFERHAAEMDAGVRNFVTEKLHDFKT